MNVFVNGTQGEEQTPSRPTTVHVLPDHGRIAYQRRPPCPCGCKAAPARRPQSRPYLLDMGAPRVLAWRAFRSPGTRQRHWKEHWHDRAARRHEEGPVPARGRGARRVRGHGQGVRRSERRVRDARPAHRPLRLGHLVVLRTEDLGHRRPRRRVGAGGGRGAARGRRRDARAALGDRPRRGGRRSLRGRRPRPALPVEGRRAQLGAQPRPLGAPLP